MMTGEPDARGSSPSDRPSARCVVVPILDEVEMDHSRELGLALAADTERELVFLNPLAVPAQSSVFLSDEVLASHRAVAERVRRNSVSPDAEVVATGRVRVGHSTASAIREAVTTLGATTVVLQETLAAGLFESLFSTGLTNVLAGLDADAIVSNGRGDLTDVASILVPVAAGPHSGVAIDVARSVAVRKNAWIELLHVVPEVPTPEQRRTGERLLREARNRLGEFDRVDEWLLAADDTATAIVEQSAYYDVVVMGGPTKSRLRQFISGSTPDAVSETALTPVVVAYSRLADS
ncbi:MAG: universal stress protein [Halobacteriota archaeon]